MTFYVFYFAMCLLTILVEKKVSSSRYQDDPGTGDGSNPGTDGSGRSHHPFFRPTPAPNTASLSGWTLALTIVGVGSAVFGIVTFCRLYRRELSDIW